MHWIAHERLNGGGGEAQLHVCLCFAASMKRRGLLNFPGLARDVLAVFAEDLMAAARSISFIGGAFGGSVAVMLCHPRLMNQARWWPALNRGRHGAHRWRRIALSQASTTRRRAKATPHRPTAQWKIRCSHLKLPLRVCARYCSNAARASLSVSVIRGAKRRK